MKRFASAALAAILVLSSVALSGCNGDPFKGGNGVRTGTVQSGQEEQSSAPGESSKVEPSDIKNIESKPEITSEQITQLKDMLNTYKEIPGFNNGATSIDAKSISEGKKVTFIADNMNNTFTNLVASQFVKTAKTVGFAGATADESDGTPALDTGTA